MAEAKKNDSEIRFVEYLRLHNVGEWEYEAETEEKKRRPDYRITLNGKTLYFDVKEFRSDEREKMGVSGAFDPYRPIRQKINEVREQFREYKDCSCSLVLFNVDAPLVCLDDWTVVMGSMLGDSGYRFAVDTRTGEAVGEFTRIFANRGKMVNYKRMEPQNTTISALIVLDSFPLGRRRLAASWKREERESKKKMDWPGFVQYTESLRSKGIDAAETVTRVVVYENPYARLPLTRELFTGRFDERFGPDGDNIVRLFVGSGISELEAEEAQPAAAG
jgi:hypothetical protein